MKIKSLLSLFVCGVASQFMMGCSSGQYFDFSTPATTYHKATPAPAAVTPATTVETATPEAAVVAQAEPTQAVAPLAAAKAAPALEANVSKAVASAEVARTAPLTSASVASALEANASAKAVESNLSAASSKKDVKMATKKMLREVKATKKANALNQYVKIGLILLVAGLLVSAVIHGPIGGIIAIVGLVFVLLGVLEM